MSIVVLIYEICVIESMSKFLVHTPELELSKSKSVTLHELLLTPP